MIFFLICMIWVNIYYLYICIQKKEINKKLIDLVKNVFLGSERIFFKIRGFEEEFEVNIVLKFMYEN